MLLHGRELSDIVRMTDTPLHRSRWIFAIAATVVLTVSGWLAVDWLTGARDLENERREVRTQVLVQSYVDLSRAGQSRNLTVEEKQAAEDAIARIQILGSLRENAVLRKLLVEKSSNWAPLIKVMRDELRRHYDLAPISADPVFFSYPRGRPGRPGG